MKSKIFTRISLLAELAFLALSLQGLAQEPLPPPPPEAGVSIGARMFFFKAGPPSKVVTGKPYSAEETIEITQVLADDNRIVHKDTAQVDRDSQGRTRSDRTLSSVGPWAVQGKPPEMIEINDPVAGVRYLLNVEKKTAVKLTPPPPGGPGAPGPDRLIYKKIEGNGPNFQRTTESLGNRVIEGVLAQGTRTTMMIPAGAIGNEKPITVVDERWFAPELQVDVLTKHSDPRFGETDFKLTNIEMAEPDPSLFQVPPDYSVVDKPGNNVIFNMRTEGPQP